MGSGCANIEYSGRDVTNILAAIGESPIGARNPAGNHTTHYYRLLEVGKSTVQVVKITGTVEIGENQAVNQWKQTFWLEIKEGEIGHEIFTQERRPLTPSEVDYFFEVISEQECFRLPKDAPQWSDNGSYARVLDGTLLVMERWAWGDYAVIVRSASAGGPAIECANEMKKLAKICKVDLAPIKGSPIRGSGQTQKVPLSRF